MRFLYDFILGVGAFFYLAPLFFRGKYRTTWKAKLGFSLPTFHKAKFRVWIHAVSVGEVRAASAFVKKMEKERPEWDLVVSTTTETGLKEARRILPGVSSFFLMPLDFSWVIKRLAERVNPALLILVEGDLWYNLLHFCPKTLLINGKISERSTARFTRFPFFAQALLRKISLFCVQNELYAQRFSSLGVSREKIVVTGNLKLDLSLVLPDVQKCRQDWGVEPQDRLITIGSTHEGEERSLLKQIKPLFSLFPRLKIFLVPRHPERFKEVYDFLEKENIPFISLSEIDKKNGREKVILIDTMGQLNTCYALSEIAIVGGSFTSKVGGHNIFEPVSLSVPVLFGPSMYAQEELVRLVLKAGAGRQIQLKEVFNTLQTWLENPPQEIKEAAKVLSEEVQGATKRTWSVILENLSQKDCG